VYYLSIRLALPQNHSGANWLRYPAIHFAVSVAIVTSIHGSADQSFMLCVCMKREKNMLAERKGYILMKRVLLFQNLQFHRVK
jgi:hypothetical protein